MRYLRDILYVTYKTMYIYIWFNLIEKNKNNYRCLLLYFFKSFE